MTAISFKDHLARQLGFIERSCKLYDEGFQDEGIRIATSLRVIFYKTTSSISIISHLGNPSITIHSTCNGSPHPQQDFFNGFGAARQLEDGSRELIPSYNITACHEYLLFPKWWEEIIWQNDQSSPIITRRDLVLGASNQDGGAHVDSKLLPSYKSLTSDGSAGSYMKNVGNISLLELSKNAHLMCLRQLGWEVLNSPDLTALTK